VVGVIMKREVEINVTSQAKMLLKNMPNISENDFINWFCNHRRISAGGGDLINYLEFLNSNKG
jgi:hypothetical protein